MGRVFSWDEVFFGKIPRRENFAVLRDYIGLRLSQEESVSGGLFFGSITLDKHNSRSDLDLLLIYQLEAKEAFFKLLRQFDQHASDLYIPFRPVAVSLPAAQSGRHTLGSLFFNHLLRCARDKNNIIRADPLPLIKVTQSARADFESYIADRLAMLNKCLGANLSEDEFHRFLSKILELPVHLSRKLIALNWPQEIAVDDSTSQIIRVALDKFPGSLTEILQVIIGLNIQYNQELKKRGQQLNYSDYSALNLKIAQAAYLVIDFFEQVYLFDQSRNRDFYFCFFTGIIIKLS